MLKPVLSKRFKKDLDKILKQGKKGWKVKAVMTDLIEGMKLDPLLRDHPLRGNWNGFRDCHIEPDLVLIYRLDKQHKEVRFERLGSHSELFGK